MTTFFEAKQVCISLRMKLSKYAWYNRSTVVMKQDGYSVLVNVKKIDNVIRKIIPPVINGVSIKMDVE